MKSVSIKNLLKKSLLILLCLAFLTACGSEEANSSVESSTQSSVETSEGSVDTSSDNSTETEDKSQSPEQSVADESTAESTEESKEESKEESSNESESSEEEPSASPEKHVFTGTYKGVENFHTLTSSQMNTFKYVFEVDGKTKSYSIDNSKQKNYAMQNILQRGYDYKVTLDEKDNYILSVEAVPYETTPYKPVISGTPGEKTIANFIKTAFMPVGTTLYIYGGGWNWQDDGSSVMATTIGISDTWVSFFNSQDAKFSYSTPNDRINSYYPHGKWNEYYFAGLDCSGYVGWAVYNLMNTESGNEGYVISATKMAKNFASRGFGTWSQTLGANAIESKDMFKPGNVISKSGHVYISLGTCDDGSIVILHSTPSDSRKGKSGGGVQLSAVGKKNCEAYKLADYYMKTYFPQWYKRYPVVCKDYADYTTFSGDAGILTWNAETLSDKEGLGNMSAKEVLEFIFEEK